MRLAPIAAAWLLAASASAQTRAPVVTSPLPAQNRANAAVTGAPSVLLASAAAQPDLCTGVQSAAYGSPMLAVTFDLQRTDKACARIRKAKALQLLGLGAAAVQVMCDDREVRAAMARAGTPCELQRESP